MRNEVLSPEMLEAAYAAAVRDEPIERPMSLEVVEPGEVERLVAGEESQ